MEFYLKMKDIVRHAPLPKKKSEKYVFAQQSKHLDFEFKECAKVLVLSKELFCNRVKIGILMFRIEVFWTVNKKRINDISQ